MNKKLVVSLDCDDVLYHCTSFAVNLANERNKKEGRPLISYEDIRSWGKTGNSTDQIFEYFSRPEFYRDQPVIDGAVDFVKELMRLGCEVVVTTAIPAEAATIRAVRVHNDFGIPRENIILGSRKDLIKADVTLDDGSHNIINSGAKYPVVMRRGWNEDLSGCIAVNNYSEFLTFIKTLLRADEKTDNNCVYALVGPSCSGKTAIVEKLKCRGGFCAPVSTTTRNRRAGEAENSYNFVSKEQFDEMKRNGEFLETTVYAGNQYGTTKEEIDKILEGGKNAVIPIDFCGANALKLHYGRRCKVVFIKRPKNIVIRELLTRFANQLAGGANAAALIGETQTRISSLNDEYKNEDLCDYTILNNKSIDEVVDDFVSLT